MIFQPAHLIFAAGTAVYLVIRAVFQRRAASGHKAVSHADLRDRLLVVLVGACQVGLPAVLMLTPWLDTAHYARPPALTWFGAPLLAGALWLFWRSHADLGVNWSVTLELDRDHALVTRGVYGRIRHPMYASFFAMALAQALLLDNWIAGWGALLAVGLLYRIRTPREEQMMLESFGDAYRAYMQRTGGVVPRAIPRS